MNMLVSSTLLQVFHNFYVYIVQTHTQEARLDATTQRANATKIYVLLFFFKKTTKPLISPCHYYRSRLRIPLFFLPHNFYISISWCFSRKKKQTPSTVSHHGRTSFKKCGPSLFHGRKNHLHLSLHVREMQHYQRCRILQTKDSHNVYISLSHCHFVVIVDFVRSCIH